MSTLTRVRWLHPGEPFEETYDLSDPDQKAAYDANSEIWPREILEHHSDDVAREQQFFQQNSARATQLAMNRITDAQLKKLVG